MEDRQGGSGEGWCRAPGRLALALLGGAWLAGLAGLVGCAHVYVGDDGSRNVVGLVWLTLPPAATGPAAAEAIRTRSLGLTLTLSEAGNALTLGYSDATLAFVRNDSLVPAAALLLDTEWDTAWAAYSPGQGARR